LKDFQNTLSGNYGLYNRKKPLPGAGAMLALMVVPLSKFGMEFISVEFYGMLLDTV
jgi:hypothetical protein